MVAPFHQLSGKDCGVLQASFEPRLPHASMRHFTSHHSSHETTQACQPSKTTKRDSVTTTEPWLLPNTPHDHVDGPVKTFTEPPLTFSEPRASLVFPSQRLVVPGSTVTSKATTVKSASVGQLAVRTLILDRGAYPCSTGNRTRRNWRISHALLIQRGNAARQGPTCK